MRPLAELRPADLAPVRGLVFDLDDTVLTAGELTLEAYGALHQLRGAGFRLVVCTGRPLGWGELLVRQWPIDLAVTENGAVTVVRDGTGLRRIDRLAPAARSARRERLRMLAGQILALEPTVELADDHWQRVSDLTIDVGERRLLEPDQIDRLRALAAARAVRTFLSSIHLHLTFDTDDKASGTLHALESCWGDSPTASLRRYAFVGDSSNDASCFGAFRLTFGVDNVRRHLAALSVAPRFVSPSARGAGFAELARRLCVLRTEAEATP